VADHQPSSHSGQFVVIEPRTDWYDPEDGRWLAQVNELRAALGPYLAPPGNAPTQPGRKGAAEFGGALLVLLSTPRALPAILEAMQAWLDKDRTRSLKVSYRASDDQESVEVTGTGMRSADIAQVLTTALTKQDRQNK